MASHFKEHAFAIQNCYISIYFRPVDTNDTPVELFDGNKRNLTS